MLPTSLSIVSLLSWVAQVPASQVRPSTYIKDDLLLDSIDFMLFIVKLERLYDISLSTEEIENIETVQDARFCVARHLSAN
jgi:acyl carrier protein